MEEEEEGRGVCVVLLRFVRAFCFYCYEMLACCSICTAKRRGMCGFGEIAPAELE